MSFIDRQRYRALYGPTTGDRIRLADTDLWIEVEHDHCVGGDEVVFGGGKVIRESMGQSTRPRADGAPDLVITGRRDPRPLGDRQGRHRRPRRPHRGHRQGRQPRHHGRHPSGARDRTIDRGDVRQRADPDRRRDRLPRAPDLPADSSTKHSAPGSPRSSVAGPDRPRAPRRPPSPGAWHLERMLEAIDQWPVNVALLGKGNTVDEPALWEQLRCGAAGFKLHEDWGTTRRRSTPACGSPTRPACRWRSTPTP